MEYVNRYGIDFQKDVPLHLVELGCWANYDNLPIKEIEKWRHLKNAILIMDEEMRKGWNDWTEKMCWAYGTYPYIAALGCTASTKTYNFHKFATYDYASDALNTIVSCTTTNSAGLEQRMWPIIVNTFNQLKKSGQFEGWKTTVHPQRIVRPSPMETKTVIRGVTIDPRADQNAIVDQLIGVHVPRRIWIVDEATSSPGAIMSAWANAMASTKHRRFIMLGNPEDPTDSLATFCRPSDERGWDSVTEDSEQWEFEFYGEKGIGLHFHGAKSPNIIYGQNEKGKDRWPFLYNQETYKSHLSVKESDPTSYYRFCVGFFAPEGVTRRVCSMAAIDKNHCREKAIFRGGDTQLFVGVDPAFGGDRCMMMFWKMGNDATKNKQVMSLISKEQIPVDPKGLPGDQIGRHIKKFCIENGVRTVGLDTTTNNSSVAEWLTSNTDLKVIWVTFGGAASDDAYVSDNDTRLCKDAYANKASELAFSVANNLSCISGLDQDICNEMCSRMWENVGEKPTKQKIENKKEYKDRLRKSPDLADCLAVSFSVFRTLGGLKTTKNTMKSRRWNEIAKKKNLIYSNTNSAYSK